MTVWHSDTFQDIPVAHTLSNSTFYDGSEISQRSLTLPRRHRRHMSSESTFVISSRDCSPIRRGSPVYCSGSLPRSTHSIPATSSQCTKAQRTIPSKHLIDEQNHMAAKSADLYNSPRRSPDKLFRYDQDRYQYRGVNSGPSSLESGKASSMLTSGPSSIDSGKLSFSRTSGHSSLDSSHASASTVTTIQSPNRSIIVNSNSPKHSSLHVGIGKSKLATDTINRIKCASSSATSIPQQQHRKVVVDDKPVLGKPPPSRATYTTTTGSTTNGLPNSNSNSSITLQVTTSNESSLPSTKIFVQNSPVRSVITLENGKLTENSNVFIINNETTTNSKGEFVKRTLSKHGSPVRIMTSSRDRDSFYSETEMTSETADSLSLISETSPDSSIVPQVVELCAGDTLENSKFSKNINNDATMNNSRKFSLQMPTNNQNGHNSIIYKNCLKGELDSNATSPPAYNKNIFGPDSSCGSTASQRQFYDSRAYERTAGSVGNLRYFADKNEKKRINSNCDLKNFPFESTGIISKLNSNPAINTDSLAHILHKSIVTVGSEPNLAHNENIDFHKQIPAKSMLDNQVTKKIDRRYSCTSKDMMTGGGGGDDIFNFPSLTDLSFNFTSLAAQKILQGVSINSIDTLVELNLAQEKQQNNVANNGTMSSSSSVPQQPAVCTDYGLV